MLEMMTCLVSSKSRICTSVMRKSTLTDLVESCTGLARVPTTLYRPSRWLIRRLSAEISSSLKRDKYLTIEKCLYYIEEHHTNLKRSLSTNEYHGPSSKNLHFVLNFNLKQQKTSICFETFWFKQANNPTLPNQSCLLLHSRYKHVKDKDYLKTGISVSTTINMKALVFSYHAKTP